MESARRQAQSIEDRIVKELEALPIQKRIFSEFEDGMLLKYFSTREVPDLARILRKTSQQIRNRANALGLRKQETGKRRRIKCAV